MGNSTSSQSSGDSVYKWHHSGGLAFERALQRHFRTSDSQESKSDRTREEQANLRRHGDENVHRKEKRSSQF